MSRVLLGLSRLVALGAVLAAPWLLSGRTLFVQVGLAAALGIAWALFLLGRCVAREVPSAGWSWATTLLLLVGGSGVVLTCIQLSCPLAAGLPPERTVVQRLGSNLSWPEPQAVSGTQVPSLTRLQLARMVWPLVVLILGSQLFAEAHFRRGLWLLLSINGAALTIFGIIQRLTWNGQIFWYLTPPSTGQPFASFWNRNHAAGYLNLCLAAVTGLLIAGVRSLPDEWWPGRGDRLATFRAAFVQMLLIVIPLGVVASASRAGILVVICACMAIVLLCAANQMMAAARYFTGSLVVAAALASMLGVLQSAQARLSGLTVQSALEDGRWRHWRDMLPACQDLWQSGSGFGTYRYVNRPYQNHALPTTYWNADNEYLELFVEGGLPAALLMVLGCGILLVFSRCSCGQQWFEVEDAADLGPVTLFLVLTQGLQAATDYGISIPANALTFALMLGALTGGWGRREEALSGTSPRVMWRWIPIAALSAVMIAGWQELRSAAEVAKFHSTLGNLDAPVAADWTTFKTDAAISQSQHYLRQRPDDFLVHRTLAQLHVIRFRQLFSAYLIASADKAKPPEFEQAWSQSHPSYVDALCRYWLRTGDATQLLMVRDGAMGQQLAAAYAEFEAVKKWCPFDPLSDVQLAWLAIPIGHSSEKRAEWLKSAVASAPSEPRLLRQIALATDSVDQNPLAAFCWNRAIALEPEQQDACFREAADRLAPAIVLDQVVEPDPASILRFAEIIGDPLTKQLATEKLKQLLADGKISSRAEAWMQLARLADLEGQFEEAKHHFQEALRLEPLRWEWRLRYVEFLLNHDLAAEAMHEIEAALQHAPQNSRLRELQEQIRQREYKGRRN